MFNLGYMAIRGIHVPQNFTEARVQFEAAAAKDLPAAWNGLGALLGGWGWCVGAGRCHCPAPACGLPPLPPPLASLRCPRGPLPPLPPPPLSLLLLRPPGVLYFHGQGVPVNFTQARLHFERAASRDHDAAFNLGTIYQVAACRGRCLAWAAATAWLAAVHGSAAPCHP